MLRFYDRPATPPLGRTAGVTGSTDERFLDEMGLLSFLFESTVGLIASFIGAMNTTELGAMASVARRWLSRLGRAVWPDVPRPHEEEVHGGRNPGE